MARAHTLEPMVTAISNRWFSIIVPTQLAVSHREVEISTRFVAQTLCICGHELTAGASGRKA